MLHSVKDLKNMKIVAEDGDVGRVKDVYFDDERWTIRHLEVDTGGWITGRRVLLSPFAVKEIDWEEETVRVGLTKQRIENAPGPETHEPVSRQQEAVMYRYFNYPFYWGGSALWGYTALPVLVDESIPSSAGGPASAASEDGGKDLHLRSADEVEGYRIHASDDTIGHIDDFLFDDHNWSIGLLVLDPKNWWPGKQVLISPEHVKSVNWDDREISVDLSRREIETSEEYDPDHPPLGQDAQAVYRQPEQPSSGL